MMMAAPVMKPEMSGIERKLVMKPRCAKPSTSCSRPTSSAVCEGPPEG